MNSMTVLQRALSFLPIRGRGRVAEIVLSHRRGEIDCHPLPEVTVHLRADQRIERWMWAGAYEPELVSLLRTTLNPGMTVLDLGANIGYFSVIAAGLVGESGQVHAFEPMPQNIIRLRKNLAPFHWSAVYPSAVGNVTGEVSIHYNEEEAGWASIHDQHQLGNLPSSSIVSAVRLDDWVLNHPVNRIDFMKLDIEGSELDALLGARQTLSQFHPTVVAETKCGWNHDEIRQLLSATGYECRSFHGDAILAIPSR